MPPGDRTPNVTEDAFIAVTSFYINTFMPPLRSKLSPLALLLGALMLCVHGKGWAAESPYLI